MSSSNWRGQLVGNGGAGGFGGVGTTVEWQRRSRRRAGAFGNGGVVGNGGAGGFGGVGTTVEWQRRSRRRAGAFGNGVLGSRKVSPAARGIHPSGSHTFRMPQARLRRPSAPFG
nr:hypothetical protein [Mycobacterium tuberculosis]